MRTTDSLIQVMDTVTNAVNTATTNTTQSDSHQWAYWLGGVLAAGVIAMGLFKHRDSEHYKLKNKLKKETVDFDGVINNAFHSQELYDILKKKVHPDRFSTQPEMIDKATEIFALIVKNKFNHTALNELKERAEKELGVKFKI